jgi:hypothetical protein
VAASGASRFAGTRSAAAGLGGLTLVDGLLVAGRVGRTVVRLAVF